MAPRNFSPNKPVGRRLRVCLLSPHAAVIDEWQDVLAGPEFHVQVQRPFLASSRDLRVPALSHARVYVVDDYAPRPTIEAILLSLRRRFPKSRVLAVGQSFSVDSAFFYLRLWVKGLLSYGEARRQLRRAVRTVAVGGFWVKRQLLAAFVDSVLTPFQGGRTGDEGKHLSRREQEVLDAVLQNLSNKEIAQRFHISERTAKFHVSNLLAKFGVRRRADLIVLSFQQRRS